MRDSEISCCLTTKNPPPKTKMTVEAVERNKNEVQCYIQGVQLTSVCSGVGADGRSVFVGNARPKHSPVVGARTTDWKMCPAVLCLIVNQYDVLLKKTVLRL